MPGATADDIALRIGSRHPHGVVYAGPMINSFQKRLKERVKTRSEHTLKFVEGYSISIVKVTEVLYSRERGMDSSTSVVSVSASNRRIYRCTHFR